MQRTLTRARWGMLALAALVVCVTASWRRENAPAPDRQLYEQAHRFEQVVRTIHRQSIDSIEESTLYRAAAEALVASLGDPYAELLTGDDYRQYRLQMAGNEVGEVPPDLGPKAATHRVGPTTVHVSAASPGVMLGHGVGYVALHRMSEGSAEEFRAEVERLRREGMTRLVVDLRLNPGGLINQGVKLAGLFLPRGDTVAFSVGRNAVPRTYLADVSAGWGNLPVVLLVNRGTASSAELIATALQDHDRVVVVGTPTYGKGVLQTTYPLGDDAALKLTTARWFGPSGRNIQRPRPDSSELGARSGRPDSSDRLFRTSMGRSVTEGRGVVPDLLVRSNAHSETEQAFLATLGADVSIFRNELGTLAAELAARLDGRVESFEVSRPMRDELFRRLVAHGVEVPRATYLSAAAYIDDQLDYEVARLALGPGAEARRRVRSDRQLQAALTVLRRARTQEQALAIAALTRQAAR
jgi:carboxyl-terminal processing protease